MFGGCIFNLENFFFASLAVIFVLVMLLVYLFKQRISSVEQNGNTMHGLLRRVVDEVKWLKGMLGTAPADDKLSDQPSDKLSGKLGGCTLSGKLSDQLSGCTLSDQLSGCPFNPICSKSTPEVQVSATDKARGQAEDTIQYEIIECRSPSKSLIVVSDVEDDDDEEEEDDSASEAESDEDSDDDSDDDSNEDSDDEEYSVDLESEIIDSCVPSGEFVHSKADSAIEVDTEVDTKVDTEVDTEVLPESQDDGEPEEILIDITDLGESVQMSLQVPAQVPAQVPVHVSDDVDVDLDLDVDVVRAVLESVLESALESDGLATSARELSIDDLKKMSTHQLRSEAALRQIAKDVSKMKKSELVRILQPYCATRES